MIIRFMSLLITVILLLSCKESKQDRVTRLINEMEKLFIFLIICTLRHMVMIRFK